MKKISAEILEKSPVNFRIGLALAGIILLMIITGLFFLPFDYNEMDSNSRFMMPGFPHLLGTDNFGRDVFSRIMAGGRYTLRTAMLTVAGSAAAGTVLGLAAGFAGGVWDEITMRIMDALSSFPGILLALIMVTLLDTGALVTALLVLFIPSYTRVMRGGTLQYRNSDFVLAAKVIGTPGPRILLVHILPNLFPQLLSASVLGLSNAILAESTMSYLGLGIQPPNPSWGRMLAESQTFVFNAPWCALAPGFMIMLTVLAFHYLGEGFRQSLGQINSAE